MKKKRLDDKNDGKPCKRHDGNLLISAHLGKNKKVGGSVATQQFITIIQEIKSSFFFKTRPRHAKIKLDYWLEVLSRPQFNESWKINKLNHLKLLNLMCQCEYLTHPFTSFPNRNFVNILQRHQINQIIDSVEKQVKSSRLSVKKGDQKTEIMEQTTGKHFAPIHKYNLSEAFSIRRSKKKINLTNDENSSMDHEPIKVKNKFSIKNSRKQTKKNTIVGSLNEPSSSFFISKVQDTSTKYKKSSSNIKNHLRSKYIDHNSILDSVDLFNPTLVSTQIWSYTHKSKKDHRSKTIDMRNLCKQSLNYSQRSYQSNKPNNRKIHLELNSQITISKKKEYWESNSYTGNVTPKYLDDFRDATWVIPGQQAEIVTYRSSEKGLCDCINLWWNANPANQKQY